MNRGENLMLDNEKKMVKEIDKLILDMLKEKMKIKKDKVSIICDDEIKEILKRIDEKMKVVFLLFQGDFSVNERNIEERMEIVKTDLNFYDKIANNIILKRLDSIIEKIENLEPINGRLISVCLDRKLFIEKVLTKNISLFFVKKHIQKERDFDEKWH